MTDRRDILSKSNTYIRKMKKGALVDAIIGLKSLVNDIDSNTNMDTLAIEAAELSESKEKTENLNEKLRKSIVNYKNEVRVLNRKGTLKSATIGDLQRHIKELEKEATTPWYKFW